MKKKMMCLLTAIVMIMIAAFSLTGCKVQNTDKTPNRIDVDQNEGAEVEITIAPRSLDNENNLVATWINAYHKKHKNVNIKISKQINNVDDYPTLASNPDTMPDIVWTMDEGHGMYSEEGYFYDLSDKEKFPGTDEFFGGMYKAVVDATHYSQEGAGLGKYFVPRDYNRLTIIYNKTIFELMGLDYPKDDWTWDDFLETCQKLQTPMKNEKDGKRYSCTKAIEWPDWAPVHVTMLANYGAQYIDNEGYFALDNVVDGKIPAQEYYEFVKSKQYNCIGDGGTFRAYLAGKTTPGAGMLLKQYADLGMCVDAATKSGWEVDTVAFPRYTAAGNDGVGYTGAGCSGYAISTTCTDKDKLAAAWDFLKWCMSEEGYDEVAHLGIVCPALESLNNSGAWTEYKQGERVLNYKAFVDTHTEDLPVNYYQVLPSASNQHDVRAWALQFWRDINENPFDVACARFKKSYDELLGKVRG